MANSSTEERTDLGSSTPPAQVGKGKESEGICLEDFQAQVDRVKGELEEGRAAKGSAGSGTGSGSTAESSEGTELAEFQASVDRLKEELAEARAAKIAGRGSLETGALAKEVLERNEGVLVPGHESQLHELATKYSGHMDDVSNANTADLENVKTQFKELVNGIVPSDETSSLKDRIKILTEERTTAMQSLSLKTTELAAEKTSRATVLKEVEGRFAKVDLPATHLQKELATARAGNKKADAYKARIATLERNPETITKQHGVLAHTIGIKSTEFQDLATSPRGRLAKIQEDYKAGTETMRVENAELRECVAERDRSLELLFGQVEEEVRAVVEKKAGEREQELRRVNEELSEAREALEGAKGLKLFKKEEREEKEVVESLRCLETVDPDADVPLPPAPPSLPLSNPPAPSLPCQPSRLALVQHSDSVLPQLITMTNDLNLANTVLRNSNTSLLLRLVGVEV